VWALAFIVIGIVVSIGGVVLARLAKRRWPGPYAAINAVAWSIEGIWIAFVLALVAYRLLAAPPP